MAPSTVPTDRAIELTYTTSAGEPQKLDVHPAAAPHPAFPKSPALLVIHGGGWSSGDKRSDLPFIPALTHAGFTVFSINYRLAPQHPWPAGAEDCAKALQYVHENAEKHNADSYRLLLLGYSAGGHLAAWTAVTNPSAIPLAGLVLLAAPCDLVLDNFRRGGPSPSMRQLFTLPPLTTTRPTDLQPPPDLNLLDQLWKVSPINHLRPGLPPVHLLHGTADKSVPYLLSQHLQKRLVDLGIKNTLTTLKDAPHNINDWLKLYPDFPTQLATDITTLLTKP